MKRPSIKATLGLVIAAAACGAPLVDGEDVVAVTGVTLIDGTGAGHEENTTLVWVGNRITHVGPDGSVRLGSQVDRIDGRGLWALPGFVDSHIHLRSPLPEAFQTMLDHGITSARVPASATARGLAVRDSVAAGSLAGPTLAIAGSVLDSSADFWRGMDLAAIVTSEEEVRAEVQAQAAAGVDFIKVYIHLEPGLVKAAIEEAHQQGLEVIGDLARTQWDTAIDLGIDALAHIWATSFPLALVPVDSRAAFEDLPGDRPFELQPELLGEWLESALSSDDLARGLAHRLAQRQVYLDPTLTGAERRLIGDRELYHALVPDSSVTPYRTQPPLRWTEAQRVDAKRVFDFLLRIVALFHDEGVALSVGTDYGNTWMTPGVAFHHELQLLSRAGIRNLDVVRLATRNGAEAAGLLDLVGTLEVGKRADVVLISSDPLPDIRNASDIVAVFQAGRRVDQRS